MHAPLHPSRLAARLATALAVLALAACADQRDPIAGIPAGAADGLYPQVVVAGPDQSVTEVRVSLLRKPAGTRLGSYQGELSFDAAALRLEQATFPTGVDGVAEAAGSGRIRFVGAALDGLGEAPLVTLRFARLGTVRPESFSLTIEEVTTADLSDVTAQVFAGTPLVGVVNR